MTQAIAINNLTDIVQGLGKIRLNLKDIMKDTDDLEVKVVQLRDGLKQSQEDLGVALQVGKILLQIFVSMYQGMV